jgi:hypothetical protein
MPKVGLIDRILPSRSIAVRVRRERFEREFIALRESWASDSTSSSLIQFNDETRFAEDLRIVLNRHEQLLIEFKDDLEKFLYTVPVRLAKHESEYSWKLEEALGKEVNAFLDGILRNRYSVRYSLGFVARCCERTSGTYSRKFLSAELKRRFYERRSAPKPGFQLTLEYARTLDGIAFEGWLTMLLRDAGVPGVTTTQASRDQGADLVITIGSRKIALQAKNYQETVGNKAVQEAFSALRFYKADEAWVVTTSTFSKDAIDLAFQTGVRLIDGSRLMNLPELLRRQAEIVTNQNELTETILSVERPESAYSPIIISQSEQPPALPAVSDAMKSGGPVLHAAAAVIAWLQSPLKRPLWRDWRFVSLGVFILFIVLQVYRDHALLRNASSEQQIRGLLEQYQKADLSENSRLLAAYYAPETFYLNRNVSRNYMFNLFQKQFSEYTDVKKFTISQIVFNDVSETRATATFNREWDFRGMKNFAGNEIEEMVFQNLDDHWFIVSEKEKKVFWSRHWSP